MKRWRRLASRIPSIRVERASGEQVGSTATFARPWRELTAIPGFTFYLLLTITCMLAFIGLIMVFSASSIRDINHGSNPYLAAMRPITIAGVGLISMWIASRVRYQTTVALAGPILLVGCTMQVIVLTTSLGHKVAGNTNWLNLGFVQFQPSELMKPGLVLWLAWVYAKGLARPDDAASLRRWVLYPSALVMALVMAGRDLGTVLIFGAIVAAVLFVMGTSKRFLLILVGLAAGAVTAAVASSGNRRRRIAALFSGEKDPLGTDLQSVRAQWGLGTGGLSGVGPGASRQKWDYLPEAHTDFIFAILGEEFGLIGTTAVIMLFMLLAWGLYRLVVQARTRSIQVIGAGCAGWLIVQALINIMVVIGWAPVVGVPLPLLSSGGSSAIANYLMLGVVLACAREEPGARQLLKSRLKPPAGATVTAMLRKRKKNHG